MLVYKIIRRFVMRMAHMENVLETKNEINDFFSSDHNMK